MNEKQKKLLDKQRFRQLWFSKGSRDALELAKVELNDEQESKVALLPKLLRETERLIRTNQSRRHRPFVMLPGIRMRDRYEEMNKPYVFLLEEFTRTLHEIVGPKAVAELVGQPMEYDSEWKRPYVIPEGLTLNEAKAKYEGVVAELREIESEQEKLLRKLEEESDDLSLDLFDVVESDPEAQQRRLQLQRDIERYRGLVEQLGGVIEE